MNGPSTTSLLIHRWLDDIERQTVPRTILHIAGLTLLLGLLDYWTGYEISFSLFYLAPVTIAAWRLGKHGGIVCSIICMLCWILSNMLAGESVSQSWIWLWNGGIRLGFFLINSVLLAELRRILDHERVLARTDTLTGALNRRALYEVATTELVRLDRTGHPLTVISFDLDHFKTINDTLGHAVGDDVLKTVVDTLNQSLRTYDSVGRLGGDEFVLLLPETDGTTARLIAPRIQQRILAAMGAHHWPVTSSFGVLTCESAPADFNALLCCADQLLYNAKRCGRNTIVYHESAERELAAPPEPRCHA